MDFNQLFCTVLSSADRYQKLLEDEDKCKILKQDKEFLQNASLAQKSELKTACQVLIENYGLYEMNKAELDDLQGRLLLLLMTTVLIVPVPLRSFPL